MEKQPIEFNIDGLVLRGNLRIPKSNSKSLAVLFIHGWTGLPNEDAAKVLAENGFSTLTFSLSGHNKSDGRLEDQTREKSLKEILTAYDLFKNKLPKEIKIVAAGNSYGGYFAAILSKERPLIAVQMRVPANYPDEGFRDQQLGQSDKIMEWRSKVLNPDATRSLRALHKFQGTVQIIEAEIDDRVPHQTVQNYVEAVSDKSKLDYHFMKGWTHSLGVDKKRNKQYQDILLNWLNGQV